jgi:hypothetical protein
LPKSTALPKEVPGFVKLDLKFGEPSMLLLRQALILVSTEKALLLADELIDAFEDLLIVDHLAIE